MEAVAFEILTKEEILLRYPDQWVLLGNPELNNPASNGTLLYRLVRGTVLLVSKDKRELAYKAKDVVGDYDETACIFTGEVPKNRIFLL